MNKLIKIVQLFIILTLFGLTIHITRDAFAVGSSGFENATLSTRSLAKSNAVVADPKDADTIAFNPAGLAKLDGNHVYAGTSLITASYEYDGTEGRSDEHNSETVSALPYLYISMETPVENLVFGIGMNSPFGLISKWNSTGNFRYTAYYNELKTSAYYLSLGYEVFPWLSVGGGWTYAEVGVKQVGKFNTSFLAGFPAGTFADSPFELDVEGEGQGWNLGFLITPEKSHSIGIFYRSQLQAELKGILTSDNLGPLSATFGGGTNTTSADFDITVPYNLTVGYQYSPTDKLDIEVDLGWTGWSSYDQTEILFGTSNAVLQGFEFTSLDYRDVISINTGASYQINTNWEIVGGYFFYDMAANKNNMSNVIPDGDRHGISIGFEYGQSNWTFDAMYIVNFIDKVRIENTIGIPNGTDIDGKYAGLVHILSTGIRYQF